MDRLCGKPGWGPVHGAGVLEHGGHLTQTVHCALPTRASPRPMESCFVGYSCKLWAANCGVHQPANKRFASEQWQAWHSST